MLASKVPPVGLSYHLIILPVETALKVELPEQYITAGFAVTFTGAAKLATVTAVETGTLWLKHVVFEAQVMIICPSPD